MSRDPMEELRVRVYTERKSLLWILAGLVFVELVVAMAAYRPEVPYLVSLWSVRAEATSLVVVALVMSAVVVGPDVVRECLRGLFSDTEEERRV